MYIVIMIISIIIFSTASAFAGTTDLNNTSFNWINTCLLIIGMILLGWYQKHQIGLLKKEVESQKNIISSLKQYSDIIDISKIKELKVKGVKSADDLT